MFKRILLALSVISTLFASTPERPPKIKREEPTESIDSKKRILEQVATNKKLFNLITGYKDIPEIKQIIFSYLYVHDELVPPKFNLNRDMSLVPTGFTWPCDRDESDLITALPVIQITETANKNVFILKDPHNQTKNSARIWNIKNRKIEHYLHHKSGHITGIAISPQYFATYCDANILKIWDAQKKSVLHETVFHDLKKINISPCGNYILLTTSDNYKAFWNLRNQTCKKTSISDYNPTELIGTLEFNTTTSERFVLINGGKKIACITQKNELDELLEDLSIVPLSGLEIRDTATFEKLQTLRYYDPITAVAASPEGKYIATGSMGEVTVWDAQTYKVIKKYTYSAPAPEKNKIGFISYSADGKYLAFGFDTDIDGIQIYKSTADELVATLDAPVNSTAESNPEKTTLSATGKYLIANK